MTQQIELRWNWIPGELHPEKIAAIETESEETEIIDTSVHGNWCHWRPKSWKTKTIKENIGHMRKRMFCELTSANTM